MLTKVKESGAVAKVKKLPFDADYVRQVDKFAHNELMDICDYINSKIKGVSKFSVATLFGGNWGLYHKSLQVIYDKFKNEQVSGLFLGRLVYELVMADENEWMCTKSPITKRDFEINFYWRKDMQ